MRWGIGMGERCWGCGTLEEEDSFLGMYGLGLSRLSKLLVLHTGQVSDLSLAYYCHGNIFKPKLKQQLYLTLIFSNRVNFSGL